MWTSHVFEQTRQLNVSQLWSAVVVALAKNKLEHFSTNVSTTMRDMDSRVDRSSPSGNTATEYSFPVMDSSIFVDNKSCAKMHWSSCWLCRCQPLPEVRQLKNLIFTSIWPLCCWSGTVLPCGRLIIWPPWHNTLSTSFRLATNWGYFHCTFERNILMDGGITRWQRFVNFSEFFLEVTGTVTMNFHCHKVAVTGSWLADSPAESMRNVVAVLFQWRTPSVKHRNCR